MPEDPNAALTGPTCDEVLTLQVVAFAPSTREVSEGKAGGILALARATDR